MCFIIINNIELWFQMIKCWWTWSRWLHKNSLCCRHCECVLVWNHYAWYCICVMCHWNVIRIIISSILFDEFGIRFTWSSGYDLTLHCGIMFQTNTYQLQMLCQFVKNSTWIRSALNFRWTAKCTKCTKWHLFVPIFNIASWKPDKIWLWQLFNDTSQRAYS